MPKLFKRCRGRLKKPVRLSDLLGSRARRFRFSRLHRLEVIRQKWAAAAGDFVAKHVIPVRLVRKTLRVATEDSGWVSEMTYLSGPILERLQELLPGKWVEEIRAVVGEPPPPLKTPAPQVVPAEPTADMRERVRAAGDGLRDEKLAAAFQRAMLASLRRLDAGDRDTVDQGHNQSQGEGS